VSGRGQLALIGKPGQEGLDLGCAQVLRVAQPAKADEGLAPMHYSLLGAPAVVQVSNPFAHLIQLPRRTQGWQRVGLDGPQCCARLRRTWVSLRHRIVLAAASHRPACAAPKGLAQWP